MTTETTLPFHLGATRQAVESHLGSPSLSRFEFGEVTTTYADHGILLVYKDDTLIRFDVYRPFPGKVLGMAIDTPFENHRSRLGPPSNERADVSSDLLTWPIADYFLQIEIWNADGDEPNLKFTKGHIRTIKLLTHILTEEEARARCAELFQSMFADLSEEEIDEGLNRLEAGDDTVG